MDLTITIIYCVCEEFSKAMALRDDPQARLCTAEVMTPSRWWPLPSSEAISRRHALF
jgi:hypothetical protein